MSNEDENVNTAKAKTQGITPTNTDQVPDPNKVVNINQDKLAAVKNTRIVEWFKVLDGIAIEREDLNSRSTAVFAEAAKLGIPTKAMRAAYQRYSQSDSKLAEFDAGFQKCCTAVGKWFQPSLFSAEGTVKTEVSVEDAIAKLKAEGYSVDKTADA